MKTPETTDERDDEPDHVNKLGCIVLGVRTAKERGTPVSDEAGEAVVRVSVTSDPDVAVTVRKCGTCAVKCILVEPRNGPPLYAAPAGELTFLPQCSVIE
jgi:hypothetical protein